MSNPAVIADQLDKLSRELDDKTREYTYLETRAVEAKRDYEVAYARAFLADDNTGPVEAKTQRARLATADARFIAEVTAAQLRAAKEAIRTLNTRIDVGRTLASNSRAEMQMAGAT